LPAGVYNVFVRRLGLILIVGLLSLSASGMVMLATGERCADFEQSQGGDNACPPTCVTCGCCAQAVEPVSVQRTLLVDAAIPVKTAVIARLLKSDPGDILHVPKHRFA
jgi:hypothetical protein